MSLTQLYIAASIDGRIARSDGSTNFLENYQEADYGYYSYDNFYKSTGSVVMGRKSYETVLDFDCDYPYVGKRSIVLTMRAALDRALPGVETYCGGLSELVQRLKAETKGNIWIMGGGDVISQFVDSDLVDEIYLFTLPIILGEGIRLWPENIREHKYELVDHTAYTNGVTLSHFKRSDH